MTAGLPPVGELVQITFRQQADAAPITGLGYVEQIGDVCGWWCVWPPRATSGENCDLGWQVESWCRVLLLPDTDEAEAVERVAGSFYNATPGQSWAALTDEDRRFYLALNGHGFRADMFLPSSGPATATRELLWTIR